MCIPRSRWWTRFATCRARSKRRAARSTRRKDTGTNRWRGRGGRRRPGGRGEAGGARREGYPAGGEMGAGGAGALYNHRGGAFRPARGPPETRLYLETVEQVLPGKKKLIIDSTKARRQLFLLEDSVEIG